tara:strand:- start:839 stop:1396 length:558 start_codon:yes stop_codon:yes gene_type:complete
MLRIILSTTALLAVAGCQTTQQSNACTSRSPLIQLTDMLRSLDQNSPARKGPTSVEGYFSDCIIYDFLTAEEQLEVHNVALELLQSSSRDNLVEANWESKGGLRKAVIQAFPAAPELVTAKWTELANARGASFDTDTICRPVVTEVTQHAQVRQTGLAYCLENERSWLPVGEIPRDYWTEKSSDE